MKNKVLRAILGKKICQTTALNYCHIDRVIVTEGNKAIVSAIVKTLDKRIFHWFVETEWDSATSGVYIIKNFSILKEDELDGFTTHYKSLS